jgi:hypothetical protein
LPNGRELIEAHFPGLRDVEWHIRSDRDTRYNCVAFALGDDSRWWQPPPWNPLTRAAWYWPPDGPSTGTLDDYVWVFEREGYERCADGSHEVGYEKIALYETADGQRVHVSKMDASGTWFSKLGRSHDIEHPTVESVSSEAWSGLPRVFLRRQLPPPPAVILPR